MKPLKKYKYTRKDYSEFLCSQCKGTGNSQAGNPDDICFLCKGEGTLSQTTEISKDHIQHVANLINDRRIK